MRVAERSWRMAGGVRAEDPGRRRRGRAGAVYRFAVGGPVACPAGAVVFFSQTEACWIIGAGLAGRDLPLPRFPAARGGVMESFAHDCVSLDASAACMLASVLQAASSCLHFFIGHYGASARSQELSLVQFINHIAATTFHLLCINIKSSIIGCR